MSVTFDRPDEASSFVAQMEFAFTRYPGRVAFIEHDGTEVSYETAYDRLLRLVAALAGFGVSRGITVACLGSNSSNVYLAELAVEVLGGIFVGLHPLAAARDHALTCDDVDAGVLLVDPGMVSHASDALAHMSCQPKVLSLGASEAGVDVVSIAAEATGVSSLVSVSTVRQDDLVRLNFTGGTSGRPKGIEFTHAAFAFLNLNLTRSLEMPRTPRYLCSGPITHGASIMLMPTLLSGGTIIFQKGFDANRWLHSVGEYQANFAFVVPTMIYSALDAADRATADLSSLETLAYGASPMSPARLEEGLERFGSVFTQFYGQAESFAQGTSLWKAEHDPANMPHLLASCGRAVPGVTIGIVDDEDNLLPNGERGELVIRCATIMRGYWKQRELTAETLRNGWLHTGDVAVRDDDGYHYIVDRKKDMIISGGFNVFPREIEDILTAHPALAQATVIGVPHERWGEQVTAVVVPKSGVEVSAQELIELVKQQKGSHYAPKEVEFRDSLPQTSVGKVDKLALREEYWSDARRSVN